MGNFHRVAVTHSSNNRRARFPQPSGAHRRRCHSNRAPLWNLAIVTRLIFSVPLLAHIARPIPHRPSQFSRPAFFYRSFFWALLQANSCVRQLRGFCFPGSALTPFGFPPIKQPFALEAEAIAFGCPRKMGQKKETFSCPTYMLSGIASGVVCLPAVQLLKHVVRLRGHSRSGGLRRR